MSATPAPARILIIDDDPQVNRLVGEFLRRAGFTVLHEAEGVAGLALAAATAPDLILCDLDMPGLNGWGVIDRLRKDPQLQDIPVIFLSACQDREKIRLSINLGGDDFLAKPAQLDEVLAAVRARLARQQQQTQRELQKLKTAVEIYSGIVHDLGSHDAGIRWLAKAARNKRPLPPEPSLSVSATPRSTEKPAATTAFLAASNSRRQYVKLSEVKAFLACGEYSQAFWGDQQKMMFRKPLKQWIQELPADQFIRIHRQAIINLNFLDYVGKGPDGEPQVHLRDFPQVLPVSQRCAPQFNRRLKQFQPL